MYFCLCACVNLCAPVYEGACRGQKREPEPLEAALYLPESCWVWVLGSKLWLSRRGASALNCRGISPAPLCLTFSAGDPGTYYSGHHLQDWGHTREDSAAQAFLQGCFRGPGCFLPTFLSKCEHSRFQSLR